MRLACRGARPFAQGGLRGKSVSQGTLDTKERVRQATDIVDLVGSDLQLRRQGNRFVGLCPWHDDTRPSMQVNPERQSFRCWVCDLGGDVFTYVMKRDGVEFGEALRLLADRAGIELNERFSGERTGTSDKRTLLQVLAWAEQQFHQCLSRDPRAEVARQYLADRGIRPASIEQFHIGFAPNDWDWLSTRAKGTSFDQPLLEKAGLLVPRQNGNGFYDRFRGRLIFSIRDAQSRPVGFGGRVLPGLSDDSPAKYINTPETPLFAKSKLLYALDTARDAIRRTRTAIIMEGYTDVIVAHEYGVNSAVAVLGTALTERHLTLLQGNVDRVILVLDGDEAGRRRANEILELFVGAQMDLRILTLPDDMDPCDFLQQHGGEAFQEQLELAVDALDHKYRLETGSLEYQTQQTHAAAQAMDNILHTLSKAPARVDGPAHLKEAQILQRLSHQFGLEESVLRGRLTQLRRGRPVRQPAPSQPEGEAPSKPNLSSWERAVLELLLQAPQTLPTIRQEILPDEFAPGAGRLIYITMCHLSEQGHTVNYPQVALQFDDPTLQNLLVELDENGAAKGAKVFDRWLEDVLQSYRNRQHERTRRQQQETLRTGRCDQAEEDSILMAALQAERRRQGIQSDR